jgi:hypothetical protein
MVGNLHLFVSFLAVVDGFVLSEQTSVSLECSESPKRGVINRVVFRSAPSEEGAAEALRWRDRVGSDEEHAVMLIPVANPFKALQECGTSAAKMLERGHVLGDPVRLKMRVVAYDVSVPRLNERRVDDPDLRRHPEVSVTFESPGASV